MTESENLPILVIGRGIFGICGAIECSKRFGSSKPIICVGKVDRDSSTYDVSKITRGDYGDDELYTKLHAIAIERWRAKEREWNMSQEYNGLDSLFHWTGVSLVSRAKNNMRDSTSYESTSLQVLQDSFPEVAKRCEVFNTEEDVKTMLNPELSTFHSGYYNPHAGWIESGLVLERLNEEAERLGVKMISQQCESIVGQNVVLDDGRIIRASKIVVCCGAWTPFLIPETRSLLTPNAQPIFLFAPKKGVNCEAWYGRGEGGKMCPITLDITETGFYVFPFHKRARVLKFGHHGPGHPINKPMTEKLFRELEKQVQPLEEERMNKFLEEACPSILQNWTLARFRLCQYCDSKDSHFLVDKIRPNLIVASGGSGHGFKFGPVLGELIADKVMGIESKEGVMKDAADRFKFRVIDPNFIGYEKARNTAIVTKDLSKL